MARSHGMSAATPLLLWERAMPATGIEPSQVLCLGHDPLPPNLSLTLSSRG